MVVVDVMVVPIVKVVDVFVVNHRFVTAVRPVYMVVIFVALAAAWLGVEIELSRCIGFLHTFILPFSLSITRAASRIMNANHSQMILGCWRRALKDARDESYPKAGSVELVTVR